MTRLTKKIQREATRTTDGRSSIIISLEPGDVIGFRAKRTRRTYRLPVSFCYRLAVESYVREQKRLKKLSRKNKT